MRARRAIAARGSPLALIARRNAASTSTPHGSACRTVGDQQRGLSPTNRPRADNNALDALVVLAVAPVALVVLAVAPVAGPATHYPSPSPGGLRRRPQLASVPRIPRIFAPLAFIPPIHHLSLFASPLLIFGRRSGESGEQLKSARQNQTPNASPDRQTDPGKSGETGDDPGKKPPRPSPPGPRSRPTPTSNTERMPAFPRIVPRIGPAAGTRVPGSPPPAPAASPDRSRSPATASTPPGRAGRAPRRTWTDRPAGAAAPAELHHQGGRQRRRAPAPAAGQRGAPPPPPRHTRTMRQIPPLANQASPPPILRHQAGRTAQTAGKPTTPPGKSSPWAPTHPEAVAVNRRLGTLPK
jgi:hypothetical protein